MCSVTLKYTVVVVCTTLFDVKTVGICSPCLLAYLFWLYN